MKNFLLLTVALFSFAYVILLKVQLDRYYYDVEEEHDENGGIGNSNSMSMPSRLNNNKEQLLSSSQKKKKVNGGIGDGGTTRNSNTSNSLHSPPYAYAFVLGGVDPDLPAYRVYLYGIYVASYILREQGSKADILLFVELYDQSSHNKLPQNEVRVLEQHLGVTIKYLLKLSDPSFYRLQLNKFRILGQTQYRRIMFLDADVMPMANLDYLFEYSDPLVHGNSPPALQPNFIVWGKYAPANGGTFMLAPHDNDLVRANKMILQKERYQKLGHKFNKTVGWGHEIQWQSLYSKPPYVDGWNFYAAQGDQGLLYYWTMYVQRQVSVLISDGQVQTWGPTTTTSNSSTTTAETKKKKKNQLNGNEVVELKNVVDNPFPPSSNLPPKPIKCWETKGVGKKKKVCNQNTIWNNFVHFYGPNKPWVKGYPYDLKLKNNNNNNNKSIYKSPVHYWFYILSEINTKYNAGITPSIKKIKVRKNDPGHPGVSTKSGFQNYSSLTNLLD